MPEPGELITEDLQVQLRDYLIGDPEGTSCIIEPGIRGLLHPGTKTQDTNLAHRAGFFPGRDRQAARTLYIPFAFHPSEVEDVMAAWAVSLTPIRMDIRLPYFGHVYVMGLPRELEQSMMVFSTNPDTEEDCDTMDAVISVLGIFVCPDPTITPVLEGS